jgi:hypothetical protein
VGYRDLAQLWDAETGTELIALSGNSPKSGAGFSPIVRFDPNRNQVVYNNAFGWIFLYRAFDLEEGDSRNRLAGAAARDKVFHKSTAREAELDLDWAAAEYHLRFLLQSRKNNIGLQMRLHRALSKQGRTAEAESNLKRARELSGDSTKGKLLLTGDGRHLQALTAPLKKIKDEFTIEAWLHSWTGPLFSFDPDGSTAETPYVGSWTGKNGRMWGIPFDYVSTIQSQGWAHVAIVYKSRQVKAYINGKYAWTSQCEPPDFKEISKWRVGAHPNDPLGAIGWLRSMRISSSARYTADFQPQVELLVDDDAIAVFEWDNKKQRLEDKTGNKNHAHWSDDVHPSGGKS